MRFNEFSNEADNIRYTKLIFQRALNALVARHKKKIELYKNKVRIAKQKAKNRKLRSLRNDSFIDVKKPDRPTR